MSTTRAEAARMTDAEWDRRIARHFAVSRITNHAFPLAMACIQPKDGQPRARRRTKGATP